MKRNTVCWPVAIVLIAFLAACEHAPTSLLNTFGGLEPQIRNYYRDNAYERNGLCTTPEIGIITRAEVISEDSQMLIIDIRHTIDAFITMGDSDQHNPCSGFGSRIFTFKRMDGMWRVQEMSGLRKPAVTYNFNLGRSGD